MIANRLLFHMCIHNKGKQNQTHMQNDTKLEVGVRRNQNKQKQTMVEKQQETKLRDVSPSRHFTLFLRPNLLRSKTDQMWGICQNTSSSAFCFGLSLDCKADWNMRRCGIK
jgi:hypothetical protein